MKLLIAGSRFPEKEWEDRLDKAFLRLQDHPLLSLASEVVSGTARGYDRVGEIIAARLSIPVTRFPADWNKHGKSAGYIRNKQMAEYSDALVAFWDGTSKGTANMIDEMTKLKKPVVVYEA